MGEVIESVKVPYERPSDGAPYFGVHLIHREIICWGDRELTRDMLVHTSAFVKDRDFGWRTDWYTVDLEKPLILFVLDVTKPSEGAMPEVVEIWDGVEEAALVLR